MKNTYDPWIVKHSYNNEISNTLICFPYAGGSSQVFAKWKKFLPKNINLLSVQYPGRMGLNHIPPKNNIADLIESLYQHIKPYMESGNVVFFGHSLGSLASYELSKRFFLQDNIILKKLIVSACLPPHKAGRELQIHNLPDDEFIAKIKSYGGTPADIFNDKELREMFLPVLKADFSIYEKYQPLSNSKLNFPVTALGSCIDPYAPYYALSEWSNTTNSDFNMFEIKGDHFYLNNALSNFQDKLTTELLTAFL